MLKTDDPCDQAFRHRRRLCALLHTAAHCCADGRCIRVRRGGVGHFGRHCINCRRRDPCNYRQPQIQIHGLRAPVLSGRKQRCITCNSVHTFIRRLSSTDEVYPGISANSLLSARRTPLSLHLVYDRDALPAVQKLVRDEQQCCAFLDFKMSDQPDSVHLSITAPVEAAEVADALFTHFAPELAHQKS